MEQKFHIVGKLHEVFDTQTFKSNFSKREFILEIIEDPKYPQYIKFELQQDRCKILDTVKIGENLEVYFDLKGRPYTNQKGEKMYFTNLVAWKLTKVSGNNYKDPEEHIVEQESPSFEGDIPF